VISDYENLRQVTFSADIEEEDSEAAAVVRRSGRSRTSSQTRHSRLSVITDVIAKRKCVLSVCLSVWRHSSRNYLIVSYVHDGCDWQEGAKPLNPN